MKMLNAESFDFVVPLNADCLLGNAMHVDMYKQPCVLRVCLSRLVNFL